MLRSRGGTTASLRLLRRTSPAKSARGTVCVITRHRSSVIISKIHISQIRTLTDAGGESRCVLRKKARLFGQAQGEKFPGRRQIYGPRPLHPQHMVSTQLGSSRDSEKGAKKPDASVTHRARVGPDPAGSAFALSRRLRIIGGCGDERAGIAQQRCSRLVV